MNFKNIYDWNKTEFESICRKFVGDELDELLNYFKDTDFYYAPAAKSYHDNYPGGLYDHCKLVYIELCNLRNKMKKNWTNTELHIIAFGHDLCKVNFYTPKVEDGKIVYDYPADTDWSHSTKSLAILSKLIPNLLNKRVSEAIAFHMGLWTNDIENVGELMKTAQTDDDLVFFTHCADMIASRMGVNKVARIDENNNVIIERI